MKRRTDSRSVWDDGLYQGLRQRREGIFVVRVWTGVRADVRGKEGVSP